MEFRIDATALRHPQETDARLIEIPIPRQDFDSSPYSFNNHIPFRKTHTIL
jgi:hypothetical protein